MSKQDFSAEEFAARRACAQEAVAAAGLDWMILFHPVSIRWLTGSDAKSYQEFQCLLLPAGTGPLVVLTRQGEVNEFRDDALVDELHGWGGGEPDDAVRRGGHVIRVASVVEGDGEVMALPVLLRRLAQWRTPGINTQVLPPIRVAKDRFLNRPMEFERHLQLAAFHSHGHLHRSCPTAALPAHDRQSSFCQTGCLHPQSPSCGWCCRSC